MNDPSVVLSSPRPADQEGRWIPWVFVAAFGVVILANACLVYFAVSTHSGLVTEQAYEHGLDYNRYLAEAAAQKATGFQGHVALEKGVLTFTLKGKDNAPLQGADVRARFVRPAQGGVDFEAPLTEVASGRYEARPAFPASGVWNVRISAVWQTHPFRLNTDVISP